MSDDEYVPQYKRPPEEADPFAIKTKDGKDPWRPNRLKQLLSLAFWVAMFYVATAGFIHGLMTEEDGASNARADMVFKPAEYLRDMSYTYRDLTDWQISLFRNAEWLAELEEKKEEEEWR